MKEQKLYGPCGPLPSKEEATWVRALYEGYPKEPTLAVPRRRDVKAVPLPRVTPAWETLTKSTTTTAQPPLSIPRALDHGYFVTNAPTCFRESLFERDTDANVVDNEDDDGDDDQDSTEQDDE
jgi:hypothetical protein